MSANLGFGDTGLLVLVIDQGFTRRLREECPALLWQLHPLACRVSFRIDVTKLVDIERNVEPKRRIGKLILYVLWVLLNHHDLVSGTPIANVWHTHTCRRSDTFHPTMT